jgi:hypothetical protein
MPPSARSCRCARTDGTLYRVDFDCDISRAVLKQPPAPEAIRSFWNVKENDVLDNVPAQDRLWLGRTRAVTPEEPRSPGPAGRVCDLLSFRGTPPDYVAPRITEELIDHVMNAFTSDDDRALAAIDPQRLRDFLDSHRGGYLVFEG